MLTGGFAGIMSLGWAFVDARDVARAHILAMESKNIVFDYSNVEKYPRFVCSSATVNMKDVVEKLGKLFPQYKAKLPSTNLQCTLGDFMVKFGALFQPKGMRSYLQTNLGKYTYLNNDKIKNTLGMTFINVDQSFADVVNDGIKWGHIKL